MSPEARAFSTAILEVIAPFHKNILQAKKSQFSCAFHVFSQITSSIHTQSGLAAGVPGAGLPGVEHHGAAGRWREPRGRVPRRRRGPPGAGGGPREPRA